MKKTFYAIIFFFAFGMSYSQVPIDTAVNFSVKDIHGNTIELFSILDEGKIVAIDFFSTSCGPCGLYAPDFQASYEDFGENEGNVFFLSICWGDDNTGVAIFDSIYGITHPSVSGSQGGGNQVHNAYFVETTPTVILITPDRLIVEQYIWEPTHANINAAITAAGGSMVGVEDELPLAETDIKIFPNPSKGNVNVEFDLERASVVTAEVYNMTGSRVFVSDHGYLYEGSRTIQFSVPELPEGSYFLRIKAEGQSIGLERLMLLD